MKQSYHYHKVTQLLLIFRSRPGGEGLSKFSVIVQQVFQYHQDAIAMSFVIFCSRLRIVQDSNITQFLLLSVEIKKSLPNTYHNQNPNPTVVYKVLRVTSGNTYPILKLNMPVHWACELPAIKGCSTLQRSAPTLSFSCRLPFLHHSIAVGKRFFFIMHLKNPFIYFSISTLQVASTLGAMATKIFIPANCFGKWSSS